MIFSNYQLLDYNNVVQVIMISIERSLSNHKYNKASPINQEPNNSPYLLTLEKMTSSEDSVNILTQKNSREIIQKSKNRCKCLCSSSLGNPLDNLRSIFLEKEKEMKTLYATYAWSSLKSEIPTFFTIATMFRTNSACSIS